MYLRAGAAARYQRILSVVSLAMGLGDAARLVGLDSRSADPLASLGATGFTLLAIFGVMRLFAALGLWMRAQWGAMLLASATGVELALYMGGSSWVQMGLMGFIFKLMVFLATIALLTLTRAHAARSLPE